MIAHRSGCALDGILPRLCWRRRSVEAWRLMDRAARWAHYPLPAKAYDHENMCWLLTVYGKNLTIREYLLRYKIPASTCEAMAFMSRQALQYRIEKLKTPAMAGVECAGPQAPENAKNCPQFPAIAAWPACPGRIAWVKRRYGS
jgi:hypothetical protein